MKFIVYKSRKNCDSYPDVLIVNEYAEDMMLRDLSGMDLWDNRKWRRTVVEGRWICISSSGIEINWKQVCSKRILGNA